MSSKRSLSESKEKSSKIPKEQILLGNEEPPQQGHMGDARVGDQQSGASGSGGQPDTAMQTEAPIQVKEEPEAASGPGEQPDNDNPVLPPGRGSSFQPEPTPDEVALSKGLKTVTRRQPLADDIPPGYGLTLNHWITEMRNYAAEDAVEAFEQQMVMANSLLAFRGHKRRIIKEWELATSWQPAPPDGSSYSQGGKLALSYLRVAYMLAHELGLSPRPSWVQPDWVDIQDLAASIPMAIHRHILYTLARAETGFRASDGAVVHVWKFAKSAMRQMTVDVKIAYREFCVRPSRELMSEEQVDSRVGRPDAIAHWERLSAVAEGRQSFVHPQDVVRPQFLMHFGNRVPTLPAVWCPTDPDWQMLDHFPGKDEDRNVMPIRLSEPALPAAPIAPPWSYADETPNQEKQRLFSEQFLKIPEQVHGDAKFVKLVLTKYALVGFEISPPGEEDITLLTGKGIHVCGGLQGWFEAKPEEIGDPQWSAYPDTTASEWWDRHLEYIVDMIREQELLKFNAGDDPSEEDVLAWEAALGDYLRDPSKRLVRVWQDTDDPSLNKGHTEFAMKGHAVAIARTPEIRLRLTLALEGFTVHCWRELRLRPCCSALTEAVMQGNPLLRQWRMCLPAVLPTLAGVPNDDRFWQPRILHYVPCRDLGAVIEARKSMIMADWNRPHQPALAYQQRPRPRSRDERRARRSASMASSAGSRSALRGSAAARDPTPSRKVGFRRAASARAPREEDRPTKDEPSPSRSMDRADSRSPDRPGIRRSPSEHSRGSLGPPIQLKMGAIPLHARGDIEAPVQGVERSAEDKETLRKRAAQLLRERQKNGDTSINIPQRGFELDQLRMESSGRGGRSYVICHLFNGFGCRSEGRDVTNKHGVHFHCPQDCCLSSSGAIKAHGCIRCGEFGHPHTRCSLHVDSLPEPHVVTGEDIIRVMCGYRPSRHRDDDGYLPQGFKEEQRRHFVELARADADRARGSADDWSEPKLEI